MEVSFKHTQRVNIHTQHKGWRNTDAGGFLYYKARLDDLKDGTHAVRLKDGGILVEYESVGNIYNYKVKYFINGALINYELDEAEIMLLAKYCKLPRFELLYHMIRIKEHKIGIDRAKLLVRYLNKLFILQ